MVLAYTGVKLRWDPSKADTIETRFLSAIWRCPQYREYKVHVHNWASNFCMLQPAWLAQRVTHIACHYCHHGCQLSCPIPSPSAYCLLSCPIPSVTLTDGVGKDGCWDSGQKCHHIAPPMHCYLAHACSTISYRDMFVFSTKHKYDW